MELTPNSSPITFLSTFYSQDELTLVEYAKNPDGSKDSYEPNSYDIVGITESKVADVLTKIWKEHELAIQSELIRGLEVLHIPMIDFKISTLSRHHLQQIREQLLNIQIEGRDIFRELHLYASGRSFHAYGEMPISNYDMRHQFIPNVWLVNTSLDNRITDDEWCVHRLLDRRMSLRISANSISHQHEPKYIGKLIDYTENLS